MGCAVEKRVSLFISASLSTTPPSHIRVPPPLARGGKNGCTCGTMGEYCGRALRPAPTKFYIHKREDLRPLLFYPHIYFLFFFSSFSMTLLYGISMPSIILPFIFFWSFGLFAIAPTTCIISILPFCFCGKS